MGTDKWWIWRVAFAIVLVISAYWIGTRQYSDRPIIGKTAEEKASISLDSFKKAIEELKWGDLDVFINERREDKSKIKKLEEKNKELEQKLEKIKGAID